MVDFFGFKLFESESNTKVNIIFLEHLFAGVYRVIIVKFYKR